jgi:uncharacterized membrane protein
MAPKPVVTEDSATIVTSAEVEAIVQMHCSSCHSAMPTDDIFTSAPGGVILDSLDDIKRWAPRIKARSVDTQNMPMMNKTGMTEAERQKLGSWIAAGMK